MFIASLDIFSFIKHGKLGTRLILYTSSFCLSAESSDIGYNFQEI